GNLSVRIHDLHDPAAESFNALLERHDAFVREVTRVSRLVGPAGRVSERARVEHVRGDVASCLDAFNGMLRDNAWRTQEVAQVVGAVAGGDLSQKIPLEV